MKYLGEINTRTVDLTTARILWNSAISTEGARYSCFEVVDFYLEIPLPEFEYIRMPLKNPRVNIKAIWFK